METKPIKTIFLENKNINSCTILFLFNVGSINEGRHNRVIYHFVEHMIFKGTEKIPKSVELLKKLDSYGADYNAFTTNNLTGYYVKVMKEYQVDVFNIFYDMVFNSNFESEEIETERGVIKEEYKKGLDDNTSLIEDLTIKTVLRNTKYQYPVIGYLNTINRINRKDLIKYWKKYYKKENCVIVVNGNIKTQLKYILRNIKIQDKPFIFPSIKNIVHNNYKLELKKDETMNQQIMLSLCFKSFGLINKYRYTLDIILGGNMSSKLFLILREKYGLVYEIDCENTYFRECGYLQINCSFDKKNLNNTIEYIFKEINNLKNGNIQGNEIESNIKYLNSMELLSKEDTTTICEEIGTDFILTGKINTPEKNIEKYSNIKKSDILKLSKEIFIKNNLNVIIIGNCSIKHIQKIINKNLEYL